MSTRKNKRARLTFLNYLSLGLAEFISTFIFVFAGSGSRIAFNKLTGNGAATPECLISAAVAHAFALFVAVSVSTNISGGHVNPAVTFGFFTGGNISFIRGLIFWIAQLLGSIVACLVLWLATGEKSKPNFGLFGGAGLGNAVIWEIVMTFGLVFTVYTTAIDPKKSSSGTIAPITIGFIVGANILAGGTTLNPAVSFGPAVVSWAWANHWVYWVGPLVGAGLVGLIYEMSCINGTHLQKEKPTTRR